MFYTPVRNMDNVKCYYVAMYAFGLFGVEIIL